MNALTEASLCTFAKVTEFVRSHIDEQLVPNQTVHELLAREESSVFRRIQVRELPGWLNFSSRRCFWLRSELKQVQIARALDFSQSDMRELSAMIEDERRRVLLFARKRLVQLAPPAVDAPRGSEDARRLRTFDQVCDPEGAFSLCRLPYTRGRLDNLRSMNRIDLPVFERSGTLLRVDIRDVVLLHVECALASLRSTASGTAESPVIA